MRFCLALLLLLNLFTLPAHAQDALDALDGIDALPQLALDGALPEPNKVGATADEEKPIFFSAQKMEGTADNRIEASGQVEVRQGTQVIFADHVLYTSNKDVVAEGAVRVERPNTRMQGPYLELNLDTHIGQMTQPQFQFDDTHARARASSLQIQGRQNYLLHDAAYTTCPIGDEDWLLKTSLLDIDRDRQVGVAHNARVEFMGVPILYTPWMRFSLSGQRISGFLSPTPGTTNKGGFEITVPFYWNIAPNYDATIAPRIMAKRGLMLNNEFRYLQPNYFGEVHVDTLPNDRIIKRSRSRLSLQHAHNLAPGLSGKINYNQVSDDAYFRDLSGAVNTTSQTNLVRESVLTYGSTWWSTSARVQRFQTLQDPAAIIVVPYRRLPQIRFDAYRDLARTNLAFAGEFVEFSHPTAVNGRRIVAYPSVRYKLLPDSAFNLTPKIGVHGTDYLLRDNNVGASSKYQRIVPIFSLDSGVALERERTMWGESFVQTLEPRAYYVYIPYREQSQLPNFDSGQADFNFAQMFTENRFFGNDRIGDANQLTLALTSRLLDQDTGTERLRIAIGERFSFKAPQVHMDTPTETTNKSDILFAASGQISRSWSVDSAFQYNPNQSQSEKLNLAARYQRAGGKILNLGYRFTRNSLKQVDISTQWPISRRWHGVARLNYSILDKRILEALTGLEYNQNCWTIRLVAQRFATATNEVSTGYFVQLELNDLVRVGVGDTLSVIRQSIPGYIKLNEGSATPHSQNLN